MKKVGKTLWFSKLVDCYECESCGFRTLSIEVMKDHEAKHLKEDQDKVARNERIVANQERKKRDKYVDWELIK